MGPLSCVLVDHFCIVLTALYKISIFVQWLKKRVDAPCVCPRRAIKEREYRTTRQI